MSFNLVSDEKASIKAAEEYAEQLHEIYKHECYGTQKKECKIIVVHFTKPCTLSLASYTCLNTKTKEICLFVSIYSCFPFLFLFSLPHASRVLHVS